MDFSRALFPAAPDLLALIDVWPSGRGGNEVAEQVSVHWLHEERVYLYAPCIIASRKPRDCNCGTRDILVVISLQPEACFATAAGLKVDIIAQRSRQLGRPLC